MILNMIMGQLPEREIRSFERELKRLYEKQEIAEGDAKYVIKLPELSAKQAADERLKAKIDAFNAKHPLTLEEKVESFVANFLHPYITGRIRPEGEVIEPKLAELHGVKTEEKVRKSLMDLIHREFGDTAEINEFALNAYLKIAAQGLYINKSGQSVCRKRLFNRFS